MTRRRGGIDVVLLTVAVAMGVWLGVAAPDVSPIFTEAPLAGRPGGGGRR